MIRRFNYTSRIDLPHNLFAFSVSKTDPPTFDAQWSDLSEFRLPPDAAVYVEAYSSHALAAARFSFATLQDQALTLSSERGSVVVEPQPWKV